MERYYNWKEVGVNFRVYSVWALSSVIDSSYLAVWVVVQWAVNEFIINRLRLTGVDSWVLLVFQIIFAISTLIPIIVYIYVDIRIMIVRAQYAIRQEIEKAAENDKSID